MARYTGNLKWILGGSILFLLVVAGLCYLCYLWYQYSLAPDRQQAAETAEQIRQWKQSKEARDTAERVGATQTVDPVKNMSVSTDDTTGISDPLVDDIDPVKTNTSTQSQETVDVRVSSHGFGPYPEIPSGYRAPNIFDKPLSRNQELMMRVDVKLWQQGIRTEGIGINYDTGLVYPTIRGTIYVTWSDFPLPDGSVEKVAQRLSGHPDTLDLLPRGLSGFSDIFVPKHIVFKKNIPSHITVLQHSEGINPYEFLKEELK